MVIREATPEDIPALHTIRISVKENVLHNPDLVTNRHYQDFLTQKGKGWLCCLEDKVAGFVILDLENHSVWALFVHPNFEGRGIGRRLHDTMMDWYFSSFDQSLWLTTAPGTRAERFYRKSGWIPAGFTSTGEIRLEYLVSP